MPFPSRLRRVLWFLALAAVCASAGRLGAQSINPKLLNGRWTASWIRHAGAPGRDMGVYLFRKSFDLPAAPTRFVVHASADQRYELFVNGARVATGPARGDLDHWRFETVDIAPQLRAGRNLLAAIVWNFGAEAPMAQISNETGVILQGDDDAESVVNTDKTWKSSTNPAVTLLPIDRQSIAHEYFVGGPGEVVDASRYPWGWERPDFDDSGWAAAETITPGGPRGARDSPSRWFLVPRGIPLMEDTPERIEKVVRTSGGDVPAGVLQGTAAWTIPANSTMTVLLDRGHLNDGVSGGRDVGRPRRRDLADLHRGAAHASCGREEGREGQPQRGRRQGRHWTEGSVPPGRRSRSTVS